MDNITLDSTSTISVDRVLFHKMSFIYNALQSGWEVKMTNDKYSFKKKHNNSREIYLENYLKNFVEKNIDINKLIN
tara:strand:+ start:1068 stop:1295 length:228 start_codon:yes stop_codon:yes gene_type:complete